MKAIFALVFLFVYFIPTFVAVGKNYPQKDTIVSVNLFSCFVSSLGLIVSLLLW